MSTTTPTEPEPQLVFWDPSDALVLAWFYETRDTDGPCRFDYRSFRQGVERGFLDCLMAALA
jgi:hypothetical protein